MSERSLTDRVSAVTALDDPARRAMYELVSRSDQPMSRDQAARALGVSRRSAAFHLDRLADEGLLTIEFRRLTGRTGPGSGRPSKLYHRAQDELAVSVPDRRYELAGELMAAAIEQSVNSGEPVRDALMRMAGETGRSIGHGALSLERALEDHGFEPRPDSDGGLVLGNCPFHRLSVRHTEIVCELNLALLRGVAEGAADASLTMVLDPGPDRCCVRATLPGR
jgi:predicted ArsR family transcriptional regulator